MTTDTIPVTISASAARRIGQILASEAPGSMLRIAVSGGGCSGFQYNFTFDDTRAEDDVAVERDGVTVLIDAMSLDYMAGAEVDFVEDLSGSSFKIQNPQAASSCGCGSSFSV